MRNSLSANIWMIFVLRNIICVIKIVNNYIEGSIFTLWQTETMQLQAGHKNYITISSSYHNHKIESSYH